MHADDDSYLRLDHLLREMVSLMWATRMPVFLQDWTVLVELYAQQRAKEARFGSTNSLALERSRDAAYISLPTTTLPPHPSLKVLASCANACALGHAGAERAHTQDAWPTSRFYWGYIWDGTGARCTAPIRNPRNKSFMPQEQVRACG
jgi:hypothetical protein